MQLDYFSYTASGGREYNEDSVGTKVNEGNGIFIVADGLGGHKKGEVASDCAVRTILEAYDASSVSGPTERRSWLNTVLTDVNTSILRLQKDNSCIMKTTAVVLCIDDQTATWAHVGDSRLYHINNSRIAHITADHSVAYKKYAAGEISRHDINTDEDQSTLLRSLGSPDRYEAQLCDEPVGVSTGDAFCLCSDGAWEFLHDEEILIDYFKAKDARDWAEKLLLRIIDRVDGQSDNLSVITVMIG